MNSVKKHNFNLNKENKRNTNIQKLKQHTEWKTNVNFSQDKTQAVPMEELQAEQDESIDGTLIANTVDVGETNLWDKLRGLFGYETARDAAMEIFANNHLPAVNKEEIESIKNIGANSENILITLNSGDTYLFDSEQRIIGIHTSEYDIHYDYEVSDAMKQNIYERYGLDMSVPLDYMASVDIRGHRMWYYSTGAHEEGSTIITPINFTEQYKKFPDAILEAMCSSMDGILIGPRENSPFNPLDGKYGAYVAENQLGQTFMFVPDSVDFESDYYITKTPLHEGAHIVEKSIELDQRQLQQLFSNYKEILPQLSQSCYSVSADYQVTPNSKEFFADAVTNYFLNPTELERYLPEVYAFVDAIFNG